MVNDDVELADNYPRQHKRRPRRNLGVDGIQLLGRLDKEQIESRADIAELCVQRREIARFAQPIAEKNVQRADVSLEIKRLLQKWRHGNRPDIFE